MCFYYKFGFIVAPFLTQIYPYGIFGVTAPDSTFTSLGAFSTYVILSVVEIRA